MGTGVCVCWGGGGGSCTAHDLNNIHFFQEMIVTLTSVENAGMFCRLCCYIPD